MLRREALAVLYAFSMQLRCTFTMERQADMSRGESIALILIAVLVLVVIFAVGVGTPLGSDEHWKPLYYCLATNKQGEALCAQFYATHPAAAATATAIFAALTATPTPLP